MPQNKKNKKHEIKGAFYPPQLRDRKNRLDKMMHELSQDYEYVRHDVGMTTNGMPYVKFVHTVRVKPTNCYLELFEEYRNTDQDPILYEFRYKFRREPGTPSLFRYEYHPNLAETSEKQQSRYADIENRFAVQPHFHPDDTKADPICHLHYPFSTTESDNIIFEIVEWLKTDLIARFITTGRHKGDI